MSNNFTLNQANFPREFAAFVDFVGSRALDEGIERVVAKLKRLDIPLRSLYRDRYFFHAFCVDLLAANNGFQLDLSQAESVRSASLISTVNQMRLATSKQAADRLRAIVQTALRPDGDIRGLEHEARSFVHMGQNGFAVRFPDLESDARFDLLCTLGAEELEVECKTITNDTGSPIKTDLLVVLSEQFKKATEGRPERAGYFRFTLSKPAGQLSNLPRKLGEALSLWPNPVHDSDFSLHFQAHPDWVVSERRSVAAAQREVSQLLSTASAKWFATKVGNSITGITFDSTYPNTLAKKVTSVLKDAADQCSGQRPCLIWLHFIGIAEQEFLELAKFSQDGRGSGLNAIVANVLHPKASSTDRSHVWKVRFSADTQDVSSRMIIDRDKMFRSARSASGFCYDIPNTFCRFSTQLDP